MAGEITESVVRLGRGYHDLIGVATAFQIDPGLVQLACFVAIKMWIIEEPAVAMRDARYLAQCRDVVRYRRSNGWSRALRLNFWQLNW